MERKAQNIYAPKYWPLWLVVGIGKLLATLPYRLQIFLGKYLGLLSFLFSKKMRRIAKTNINLCFPNLSESEREKLLRDTFISSGIAIFETILAWFGSNKKILSLAHFHGLEHVEKARTKGNGIIILGMHFVTLELAGRMFSLKQDVSVIYRAHKKSYVNFFIEYALKKHFKKSIERNNVFGLVKALKQGEAIGYMSDIDAGYYDHIFVPFFGIPAATITAPSRLAQKTGATTLLSTYYRRDDGTGYDVIISPVDKDFPSDHLEKDITYINQLIEEAVRKKPEQYIWQYKRFKTRPDYDHKSRLY